MAGFRVIQTPEGITAVPIDPPKDHIKYDTEDEVRWIFNTETKTFNLLNLPFFFENAPDNVKTDLIEWIRKRLIGYWNDPNQGPQMPESVRAFRDDPKTVALRNQKRRGYASLEDFA